ncbi:hypothetical protein [Mesorhizobium sp.]|uniref:hypothetical protein n=1 Tax=Mesorhizobium sp. TaxID=1871066 RepID=UPI00257A8FAD|nr:hypothetical protein [Mesorhizobium sp.]
MRIHLTFLMLLAWIGIAYFHAGGTSAAIEGVGFIGAVFVRGIGVESDNRSITHPASRRTDFAHDAR